MGKWVSRIFVVSIAILFSFHPVFANTLPFEDNFDVLSNEWVQTIGGPGKIFSDGDFVLFKSDGGGPQIPYSISRTISTVGFEDIQVILTASQGTISKQTGMEPEDFLAISVNPNDGSGVQEILKDNDVWQGIHDPDGIDMSGVDSQFNPTSTSPLSLEPSASNNPNLEIIISGSNNAVDEHYNLILLQITGNPIDNDMIIGGKIIGVEPFSLLIAGVFSNIYWIIPFLVSLVGIGFIISRK